MTSLPAAASDAELLDMAWILVDRFECAPSEAGGGDLATAVEILSGISDRTGPGSLRTEAVHLLALAASEQAERLDGDDLRLPGLTELALDALAESRLFAEDPQTRAELENQAGQLLCRRLTLDLPTARPDDLGEIIELFTSAANAGFTDGRNLWLLGLALQVRFDRDEDPADRHTAVDRLGAALAETHLDPEIRAECHAIRGVLLLGRFYDGTNPADLDGSVDDLRAARDLVEPRAANRTNLMLLLAQALLVQAGDNPGPQEIAEQANCLREVLADSQGDDLQPELLLRLVSAVATNTQKSQHWMPELDELLVALVSSETAFADGERTRAASVLIGMLHAFRYATASLTNTANPADAQIAFLRLDHCGEADLPELAEPAELDFNGMLGILHWQRATLSLGWHMDTDLHPFLADLSSRPDFFNSPDMVAARHHLERAVELSANDPMVASMLALLHLRSGPPPTELSDSELRALIDQVPPLALTHPALGQNIFLLKGTYTCLLAQRTRQLSDAGQAVNTLTGALGAMPAGHPSRSLALHSFGGALALRCELRPSAADARAALGALCDAAEVDAEQSWNRSDCIDDLARTVLATMPFDLPAGDLDRAEGILRRPAERGNSRALWEQALAAIRAGRVPSAGPAAAVDLLERSRAAAELGRAELAAYRATGVRADLDSAISHLEQARTMLGAYQPTARTAGVIVDLAEAYRWHGDLRRAVETGLRALHEFAQAVLISPTPAAGLAVARAANQHVERVVGWCLALADVALAITVLEAGRGLVLHATTVSTDVPEVLRRSRNQELAEAWREDGGSAETRARILTAVPRTPAGMKLLTPTAADAIGPAVWAGGLDALVYLVAGADGAPGAAILVRSNGDLDQVSLPGLQLAPAGPLDRSRAAHRAAFLGSGDAADRSGDLDLATDPAVQTWRAALGDLSEWAYEVAVGPLLDRAGGWRLARPPRLALVPTGSLAHVPWHAARREHRGGTRYACADAVFSYAASARQLAEVVGRVRQPLASDPAFLADPTGSQVWPSIGAEAARSAFYPGAAYLGHPARLSGGATGTAAQVLRRLPSAERDGASMLQLSSHASVHDSPTESFFTLAAGERLSVAQILDRARGRRPGAPGGLVICDSCMTDLTENDHDEVLTLGTAFLAAGAVSVIGARWPLDDAMAAVLTYVLHHQLSLGLAPADALRAAQLWMLDPDRTAPPLMPAELAGEVSRPELADLVAWAAFTHQGQ